MKKRIYRALLFLPLCILLLCSISAAAGKTTRPEGHSRSEEHSTGEGHSRSEGSSGENESTQEDIRELIAQYKDYEQRFAAIEDVGDIGSKGFDVIEEQVFLVLLETFGERSEGHSTEEGHSRSEGNSGEITFIPAMDRQYQRIAIFLADGEGRIVYKTNQLETNNRYPGDLKQPIKGIAAVSFQDVNGDGLTDIVLITTCENDTGDYAGKPYKVGDVLFQGKESFYRDYRISDKINRFSMNKSVDFIAAYVRDGLSTEVLYTATTLEELLEQDFQIITEQCYWRNFEKQGRLQVVPGVMGIAEYDIFMIYLVNEQGYIVWSFQPMGDYDNLYSLKGMTGKDMDGDGMKDLVVLARYSFEGPEGELIVESDCAIYYQRTNGFDVDMEFQNYFKCTEEDTLEGLVGKIREYWGWPQEND